MLFVGLSICIIVIAYLIGSVNFAVIFARAFSKRDIRNYGSGNAGTTNVMRTVGFLPGMLTFICDALKGFIACGFAELAFGMIKSPEWFHWLYGAYACGIACMLGHVFPIFFEFKGGKGVAISVGIFSVCCPMLVPFALGAFALSVFITRIVSVSSLIAAIAVASLTFVFYDHSAALMPQAVMTLVMCLLVYLKHIENIKRLLRGEEKRLKFGRNRNG